MVTKNYTDNKKDNLYIPILLFIMISGNPSIDEEEENYGTSKEKLTELVEENKLRID